MNRGDIAKYLGVFGVGVAAGVAAVLLAPRGARLQARVTRRIGVLAEDLRQAARRAELGAAARPSERRALERGAANGVALS